MKDGAEKTPATFSAKYVLFSIPICFDHPRHQELHPTHVLTDHLQFQDHTFHRYEDTVAALTSACGGRSDLCSIERIGYSEEGRPMVGIRIGTGPIRASLLAGSHADEPVGPETLRSLVLQYLDKYEEFRDVLEAFQFFVIPHVNPDGAARNTRWIDAWPDVNSYLNHVVREKPGRDVEFSYPDRRKENRVVSGWLARYGPFHLHMSLHGMGFSDGAMLLIEKNWIEKTGSIQTGFTEAALRTGLRMHDHDRKGEKGFIYIAPGFTTTPEGVAMRSHFDSLGDPETAALFGDSSMEYVRSLGGDPLCLVTELPLYVVEGPAEPGLPTAYLAFRDQLPELRLALRRGHDISNQLAAFGLHPLALSEAMRLQVRAIELGLETAARMSSE